MLWLSLFFIGNNFLEFLKEIGFDAYIEDDVLDGLIKSLLMEVEENEQHYQLVANLIDDLARDSKEEEIENDSATDDSEQISRD